MLKMLQGIHPAVLMLIATTFEVSGDAIIRTAFYNHAGPARVGLMIAGAALVFCYGLVLNLSPLEFGQVAGLYIATLFVVWQIVNYIAFNTLPSMPVLIGGTLIISGGLIIAFWKPA